MDFKNYITLEYSVKRELENLGDKNHWVEK